ncbi:hypothetical protein CLOM_g4327 [Closterium sp. NIES-68]|nr:hypothetical protein CLOM_g4327 [Closterium sp. NIES-68]GJP75981.1 hypothetical protein CLOP_g6379 [Closterium sp. NIES-67]
MVLYCAGVGSGGSQVRSGEWGVGRLGTAITGATSERRGEKVGRRVKTRDNTGNWLAWRGNQQAILEAARGVGEFSTRMFAGDVDAIR